MTVTAKITLYVRVPDEVVQEYLRGTDYEGVSPQDDTTGVADAEEIGRILDERVAEETLVAVENATSAEAEVRW